MSIDIANVVDTAAPATVATDKPKRTRKGGPRGPRKNKRVQLVEPEGGFTAPILTWNGEALPNRSKFAAEDREYNYLASKLAYLEAEIVKVKAEVDKQGAMTKEERIAAAGKLRGEAKFKQEFGARVEAAKTDVNLKAQMLAQLAGILAPAAFAGMLAGETPEVQAAVIPLVGAELQSAIAATLAR